MFDHRRVALASKQELLRVVFEAMHFFGTLSGPKTPGPSGIIGIHWRLGNSKDYGIKGPNGKREIARRLARMNKTNGFPLTS